MPAVLGSDLRRVIIEQSYRAGVGHIGSALSVADIVACLYDGVLQIDDPAHPDRDRFVLSKGHAALALYAALHERGWIDHETLSSFCADGSALGVHPERGVPGVDISTGSLGHGLSIGAGMALGARLDDSRRRVVVLLSDAELNEGSTWEAVLFAAHHRLSALTAVVDMNGQQALGHTRDVLHIPDPAGMWRSAGWTVIECDGHDRAALSAAFATARRTSDGPTVVLARTVFGKGVSFMEGRVPWHYLPLDDDTHRIARDELEAAP